MEKKYTFENLDCPHCAKKLEDKIGAVEGVHSAKVEFPSCVVTLDIEESMEETIEAEMEKIVSEEEPDVHIHEEGCCHHREEHEHHEGCCCGEHHHHHEEEEETATYMFKVEDIDCANCAAKIESKIAQLEGISNVSLNFMKSTLQYDCAHDAGSDMRAKVEALIAKEEPDAKVTFTGHKHHHEHEEHHEEKTYAVTSNTHKYRMEGIDCADCAAKLEGKLAGIQGISRVQISFMNSTLQFDCESSETERILQEVKEIARREEPDTSISELSHVSVQNKEEKEDHTMLYRLIAGAVLFAVAMGMHGTLQYVIAAVSYVILGYDVILKAFKGIGRGQLFDEHFLMTIATFAAIYLGDMKEATGVMLFYQIGEYFQDMAVAKSRASIGALMDIRPEFAVVKRDNQWIKVNPEEVSTGEVVRVKPGERIPLDGIVTSGASSLNTASLTGESKPRDVDTGSEVISGSVNETGVLEIQVTKEYGESTVARILDLVENQDSRKATAENFITKFSRVYTPAVVFSAVAVAVIVGLMGKGWDTGIYRACTFLVISCPCALVISIPLSFFAGIGGLSSRGVLVKGANLIEALAKVEVVVMDKTGTLTSGQFAVEEMYGEHTDTVLEYAAYAEDYSNHPVALGIKASYGKAVDESRIQDVKEIAGRGVSCTVDGHAVLAGNYKLMRDYGVVCEERKDSGTLVYVAEDGKYLGVLVLRDQLKEDALSAVEQLHKEGKRVYIVSGDNQQIVDEVASKLHADKAFGGCLPEQKVQHVKDIKANAVTAFVGDGVNDAPVITSSDLGIAMGALGADAAIEAADVVIMDDKPSKISLAIASSKRILKVANENICFAILIKVVTLILGAFGIANMWMAIFADTGVAMLCVLNSLRLLHIARK